MGLEFDFNIDFNDGALKRFLTDRDETVFVHKSEISEDFILDETSRESGDPKEKSVDIPFLQEETWRMMSKGQMVGNHVIQVFVEHRIEFTVNYHLLFAKTLAESGKVHGRDLLKKYDEATHGSDIQAWMLANLDGKLEEKDFALVGWPKLKKDEKTPRDLNVEQRDAIFNLYDPRNEDSRTRGNIIIDASREIYQDSRSWSEGRDFAFQLIATGPVYNNDGPQNGENGIYDSPEGEKPEVTIQEVISRVIQETMPEGLCGIMVTEKERIFELIRWPEFKIKWVKKRIKIGCSKITISLPVLYIRYGRIEIWAWVAYPQQPGEAAVRIVITCLIASALGSAIIGLCTSNPLAAEKAFIPLFKECVGDAIKDCLDAGLTAVKDTDDWSRA